MLESFSNLFYKSVISWNPQNNDVTSNRHKPSNKREHNKLDLHDIRGEEKFL